MKSSFSLVLFIIFSAILLGEINCDRDSEWTLEPDLVTEQSIIDSELKIDGAKSIVVKNSVGSVIIIGESGAEKEIRWQLSKSVKAETKSQAIAHLEDIHFSAIQDSETVYVEADLVDPNLELEYYCFFSLLMPYNMPCTVEFVKDHFHAEYLDSVLIVERVLNDIRVEKHNGNCDVTSQQGNIEIEVSFPDSGYCRAKTNQGNISLKVPKNVSAMVNVETEDGSIKYTNLNFVGEIIQQKGQLSGQLGNGNGEVTLKSEKGNVTLEGF